MEYMRGLLTLALLLSPLSALAENAGIVRGIWFDNDNIFAGETTRVYVAIRNNTDGDLSGTVEFFVNESRIERNNIDALNGRIIESWADWTPTYGTSTLTVTLSRTEISSTASGTQDVEVVSAIAEEVIFVDYDTDKDGVGNQEDTDDDEDGISDSAEIANGTDPLVYDEPVLEEGEEDTTDEEVAENVEEKTSNNNGPTEGLERYLAESSRANSFLSNVTNRINATKERLDEYREARSENDAVVDETQSVSSTTASSTVEPHPDGFGAITRTQATSTESSWVSKVFNVIVAIFNVLYTVALAIFSTLLSFPALVELLILIFILYSIYRIARYYGNRY